MTHDDIIRMSQEAGPLVSTPFDVWRDRFAALVAVHEREACARVCEGSIIDQFIIEWNDACQSCADGIRARSK